MEKPAFKNVAAYIINQLKKPGDEVEYTFSHGTEKSAVKKMLPPHLKIVKIFKGVYKVVYE